MKWSNIFMKLTREYTGGILAGLGIGLLISGWILKSGYTELPWSGFLAFGSVAISIGVAMARAGQKAAEKQKIANKEGDQGSP